MTDLAKLEELLIAEISSASGITSDKIRKALNSPEIKAIVDKYWDREIIKPRYMGNTAHKIWLNAVLRRQNESD